MYRRKCGLKLSEVDALIREFRRLQRRWFSVVGGPVRADALVFDEIVVRFEEASPW